jgi:hypothetical protein
MPARQREHDVVDLAAGFGRKAFTRAIERLTPAKLRSDEIATLSGVDGAESRSSALSASGLNAFESAPERLQNLAEVRAHPQRPLDADGSPRRAAPTRDRCRRCAATRRLCRAAAAGTACATARRRPRTSTTRRRARPGVSPGAVAPAGGPERLGVRRRVVEDLGQRGARAAVDERVVHLRVDRRLVVRQPSKT